MVFALSSGLRAVGVRVNAESSVSGFASLPNSLVDVIVTTRGSGGSRSQVLLQNVRVLSADTEIRRGAASGSSPSQTVSLALTPEDALKLALARETGSLQVVQRRGNQRSRTDGNRLTFEALKAGADILTHQRQFDAGWPAGSPHAAETEFLSRLQYGAASERGRPIYERPTYAPPMDIFHDLVAYAPGLNTSLADMHSVLDAEAVPGAWNKPGKIEPAARALFDRLKFTGWYSLTLPAEAGIPAFTITFDDGGQFAYERILPFGLRERVVCDAQTLTHVYPQLGLAARRNVSRHHRAELAALVPWYVPPAEDLARGADLKIAGERTVAIVPHGVFALKKDADGKAAIYHVVHLVFGKDGRLAERRVVQMPSGEVVYRLTLSADGTARLLDGKDKELSVWRGKLGKGKAPELTADTKDLLVLPLPYRTAEHVQQALKLQKRGTGDLTLKEALPLFLAHVARGDGNAADQLFRQVFHAREQRQIGYYVLLASCGANLDSDHGNVLAEHIDNPLAQYLALHTSPVLRKHASQWAVGSGSWQDGFLQHLAVKHALLQRWQEPKLLKGDPARAAAETRRAIDYVEKNKDSRFGWALLSLIQDRAADDAALHGKLVDLWPLFETHAGLTFAARYETARSLWKAGKKDDAAKRFRALYEAALKDDAPTCVRRCWPATRGAICCGRPPAGWPSRSAGLRSWR